MVNTGTAIQTFTYIETALFDGLITQLDKYLENEEISVGEKMIFDLIPHYFLMSQLLGS